MRRLNESIINNDGINGVVMQAALIISRQCRLCIDFDGSHIWDPESSNGSSIYNRFASFLNMSSTLQRDRITGNVYAQITFNKNLNIRSEFGLMIQTIPVKVLKPSYEYGQLKNTDIIIRQQKTTACIGYGKIMLPIISRART